MRKKWTAVLTAVLVMAGACVFAEVDEKTALRDLQDKDPIVREAARMQLEKSGSAKAIEALGKACRETTDNNWKLALINGLGAIKKPEIVQWLLPVPEDATLADATVKAMSGLLTAETTKTIIEYFEKANTLAAGMAMIDEAEAMLGNVPNAPAAKKMFEAVYAKSKIQSVRTAAMMHLILDECKATDDNAAFLADLAKPENEYGLNAALAKWLEIGCKCAKLHLKPSGSPAFSNGVQMHSKDCLYNYFAKTYDSYSKKTQALIIANLAKAENPQFVELVRKAVESDDDVIRANALEALGVLGDISDLQTIIVESQNPKSELVRNTARRLMRHVNWPGVDAFTAMAMKSHAEYKALCINVLKDRRCRSYNFQIFNEIGVERDDVAKYAIEALKYLAVDDDAARMIGYLKKNDQYFGRMADAIKTSMLRSEQPDIWSDELVKVKDSLSGDNLATVLQLIAQLHTQKGFEAIAAMAKDDSDATRKATAVAIINQWPSPNQTASILQYMKGLNNPFDRARVLNGVIKANGQNAIAKTANEKVDDLLKLLPVCERDLERGMVFEQVAAVNDLYAYHKLEELISDKSYGDMAAAALAKNAVLYGEPEFAIISKSLTSFIKTTKGDAQKELREALSKVCAPYGYIHNWRYSNVFTAKDEKGEDSCPAAHKAVFEPEKPDFNYDKWSKFVPAKNAASTEIVTLHTCLGGVQRTAYIVSYVYADGDKEAILEIGSDDMLKAWLNGEMIVDSPKYQALVRASYKIPIKLKKGKNILLMKISQGSHNWEGCAALKNADGGLLEGWEDKF
ncbi:MAG: HEAT repeat domain-containing protein [Victivallales bacterium]|nr:HEAT repeat domain-containing protein [Victivallales bacterium]